MYVPRIYYLWGVRHVELYALFLAEDGAQTLWLFFFDLSAISLQSPTTHDLKKK